MTQSFNPQEIKNFTKNVHSNFFIKMSPNWKQPKCPSADKSINKFWYIPLMEICLAIKG